VDLGCAWLHSADRNPWTAIAAALGLEINRTLPDWGRSFAHERQLGRDAAVAHERAFAKFWSVIDTHAGADRSLAEILPANDPWLPNFAAITSFISGARPEELSVIDLARYADTLVNWRVVEGYGRLIEQFGEGLPITLDVPVTSIGWGGPGVTIATSAGTLRCRAVIVAVPVSLLAQEAIRFDPPLPAAKLAAVQDLPMGHVAKLLLAVEGDPFGISPDRQVTGALDRMDTAVYQLRPLGRPLVEAYWGGSLALELEHAGQVAMADFAGAKLAALFGAAVRGRLRPLVATSWASDPYSRGAFSYARPGGADGRAALAEPQDERLFFAGEACSTDAFSTAHGAYATGIVAAESALATLR
jgi:monoamine oxidase